MADEAAVLEVAVEGKNTNIDSFLGKIEGSLARTGEVADKAGDQIGKGIGQGSERAKESLGELDAAAAKAARESLQLASGMARLDAVQDNAAGGANRLRSALESTVGVSARQDIAIRTQIAQLERLGKAQEAAAAKARARAKAEAEAAARAAQPKGGGEGGGLAKLGGGLESVQGALGAVGIAAGAAELIQLGHAALDAGNNLESTKATIRNLAGSQRTYNEVLATATANQKIFGGSLEENLDPLRQFLFIANRSGASIGQLNKVAQLLGTINKQEGVSGAGVALSEFTSGDITSLAERFNLPRAALNEIKNSGKSATEQLQALEQVLAQQGVTMATVAAAGQTNAAAFDRMGASMSNATAAGGTLLAQVLRPVAELGTQAFDNVASGLNTLATSGDKVNQLSGALLAGSTSFADYTTQAQAAQNQLAGAGILLPTLSAQQYAYAQSLMQTGLSAEQAAVKSAGMNKVIGDITNVQARLQADGVGTKTTLDSLGQSMTQLAGTSAANEVTIIALSRGYLMGTISAEQLQAAVADLQAAQANAMGQTVNFTSAYAAATAGIAEAAAASGVATTEAERAAQASLQDAAAKEAQTAQTELLAAETSAAVDAFLQLHPGISASGVAALQAAGELNPLIAQLIQARIQAEQARIALINFHNAENAKSVSATVAANRSAGRVGRGDSSDAQEGAAAAAAQRAAIQDAQDDRIRSIGTATEKQALYNRELQTATQRYGAMSPQAIRARTALDQFTASQEKAARGGRGKGKGKGKLSEAEKEQKALLKGQEDYQNKSLDSTREFEEANGKIAEDAAKKRAEADQKYQQDALDSRSDFYLGLADVEDEGQRKAMAAKYEAIVQESQKIGQTQGSDAADAYQSAAEQALEKESQIQSKIDAAKKKAKDGKGDEKKSAQSTVEYLTGVLALQEKADQNRLDQIKNAGSQIANEENRQYAEAELRYEEHLNKLGIAYERKFKRKPGETGPDTALPDASPASSPVSAPASVAASSPGSTSAPKESGEQLTRVIDENAQQAIDSLGARLEGKLQAVADQVAGLAPKVTAVESAVKNLKASTVFSR